MSNEDIDVFRRSIDRATESLAAKMRTSVEESRNSADSAKGLLARYLLGVKKDANDRCDVNLIVDLIIEAAVEEVIDRLTPKDTDGMPETL